MSDCVKKLPCAIGQLRMSVNSGVVADDDGAPILVLANDLQDGSSGIHDRRDTADFCPDVLCIVDRERGNRAESAPHAADGRGARDDDEDVGAEAGDFSLDGGGGALTQADHRHDGADADDDAEHGQPGAQRIPAEDAEGGKNGEPEKGHSVVGLSGCFVYLVYLVSVSASTTRQTR